MSDTRQPRRTVHVRATFAAVTVAAAAAITAALVLGTGHPPARPLTAAQAARERGIATGRVLNVGSASARVTQRPLLRLGLLTTPADATALAGIRLGYLAVQLAASQTRLAAQPYTSPAAEEADLVSGHLDAAYLPPVQAVQAWQATHGEIRVIAGAATHGGTTVMVLSVTARYLARHPSQVQELLKGHIQAATTRQTDPNAADAAAATELASLTAGKTTGKKGSSVALAKIRSNCNPGAASVLAQAQAAVKTGQLNPVNNLPALYNLAMLNTLLKASGQAAVTTR